MYQEDVAHIVYGSDDKFAEILGVSLVSLYENSKDMNEIYVYVLDSEISLENKIKLNSIPLRYGRKPLNYIVAKNISEELNIDVQMDRGSLSQYARLFVSSLLPDTLERVLYLDCDIIVNKSIKNLWTMDMHGKTIAALMDAFSKYYRVNIELQPNDIMFNSGVMLIDLNRWKKQNVENQLMKFIVKYNGKIQQGDQGALNSILSKDTYCFEPQFNSITIFYDFTYEEMMIYRKPPNFYSKDEIKLAINEPVIIHFTTSFLSIRPWIEGCKHKYSNVWLKYKNLSPWKDNPLWKYVSSHGLKGIYIRLVNNLPRNIVIRISSILQVYGRPLINKFRK
jgi:lipopolysaccharide biosynthesis glycosyltransferase